MLGDLPRPLSFRHQQPDERGDEAFRGRLGPAHPDQLDRGGLRHGLSPHAGAVLTVRLSALLHYDGGDCRGNDRLLKAKEMVLAA